MTRILKPDFFNRSAVVVARELIGKVLVRRLGKLVVKVAITETEAYEGPHDLASHASKGETKRTKPMFDSAGYLYIYLVYGMYEMLNVVTGKRGHPGAVLIRSVEMAGGRLNGPGRVSKALKITRRLNHQLATPEVGLWFEKSNEKISKNKIKRTPRIGVAYSGVVWSKKLYRFVRTAAKP